MTLGEELRDKYALTSFRAGRTCMALLAINEALETAAEIADQEGSPFAASHIRSLKWVDRRMGLGSVHRIGTLRKSA